MVDSIEIRLDQLTQAIKGLYAKSSMSQGEIYNALTSLSQRYENLTTVSSEKIAATLVNEFRKTIDSKYGQTNQFISELENSLKAFMQAQQNQNPKMAAEVSRLLNDTANMYSKLNSQDLALQKIFNAVDLLKNKDSSQELAKLSDNFMNFSRGFDNITNTLNKNFADFLSQVKQGTSREEYSSLKSELDTISGNVNSVISAISVIDTKYRDLTGLIGTIQNRENIFNDALREVRSLTNTISHLKDDINSLDSKQQLQALNAELKNQIETVKYEIQKIINTAGDAGVKTEVYNLTSNVATVSNNIQNLSANLTNTKDEVRNLSTTVQNLGNELKDVHGLINDEILYKSHQHQAEFERYLNQSKEDIKALLVGLTSFKKDLNAINEGNIKVLQEPIERAMDELKNQDLGRNIKDLSDNLRDITLEIQSSIQNMQTSLNDMNSISSMQILTQISEAIPSISDKLEIFRTHVVTENSSNISQIKTSCLDIISSVQENLKMAADRIHEDVKTINIETIDTLKVDLQRLSDHLVDSVEVVSDRVQKEFVNNRVDFQEFSLKQQDNTDKIINKLSGLEVGLENFSQDTIDKINDTINVTSAQSQDVLNEIKSDILEGIGAIDRTNKTSIQQFELKIDKLLDNYVGADLDNIIEKKSLRETVVDIETKIDRTNLQQIHNAKELLEEIQSSTSNLSMKIATIEESKNLTSVLSALSKISEKIQTIEEFNVELSEEFKETKEQIEQRLKDNIQKISALLDKPEDTSRFDKQNSNIDNLSNKVQEYLSNFEFLKSNISQEIKENLTSEFSKIESAIRRIKTIDENSNYSYTLEDVESDLAKIRLTIEKNAANNEEFKNLFEKIIELRTVGLEGVKINRDVEAELGHLSGWFKDAVVKIDDLAERFDDLRNIGFEDIKTRLTQSEKSKQNVLEFSAKIENALKHIIKNAQNQDAKIADLSKKVELLVQNQNDSFNPAQFIDIFYENMTQTKMLSNRVEIIEDKINSIQNAVEKLISYVEQ
ncbi:MAG: hypothetical protein IKU37_07570 [Candidatus Gastranaerophilales bacterium]|nr:hypothetical protein [Candidatus Gastranaerophilales bacterium]